MIEGARSLNLSNAAAILAYEYYGQQGFAICSASEYFPEHRPVRSTCPFGFCLSDFSRIECGNCVMRLPICFTASHTLYKN